MTLMEHVIINGTVESCMAILSRNGYGNAIIGRYGGCFEEGILWVYDTGEKCAILERLEMVEGIWWVYGTGESCAILERLAMVEG